MTKKLLDNWIYSQFIKNKNFTFQLKILNALVSR